MVKVKCVRTGSAAGRKAVERFLCRGAFHAKAERTAASVLAEIRRDGDAAVAKYARKFDGVSLTPKNFRVPRDEVRAAAGRVDATFKKSVREVRRRVVRFAREGLKKDWSILSSGGGRLGEQFRPFDRVGVYIPGGAAPLASTVLMTVPLAKTAGVSEIAACTPCDKDGNIDPHLLYALDACGVTEIYRIGGIPAIGMMAYGTKTVAPVRKIVGPGGAYVTAAKRQVYGDVALDLVAGPSEIAVMADTSAKPAFVAADLLSQAEHGTGEEKALLVTPSERIARAVAGEVVEQAATLSRLRAVEKVIRNGMLLVIVRNIDEAIDICNRFAPEHLELMVRKPAAVAKKINAAGALFLGPWSPESAGDFVAGPSHVLPTGGAAARFSGLGVQDFQRRTSVIQFTRRDLLASLEAIEAFGRVEGLDAHARAARIRCSAGEAPVRGKRRRGLMRGNA